MIAIVARSRTIAADREPEGGPCRHEVAWDQPSERGRAALVAHEAAQFLTAL